jgi:pyruvate dehydrogenase E1 component beta subunit
LRTLYYIEAINEAIREEMERDPQIFLMGTDVSFAISGVGGLGRRIGIGFTELFGTERVRDTPLSENAFLGAAVGAALVGMRPIVEMNNASFLWMAMDQLVSQTAKDHYLFGGQATIPLVVRSYMIINGHAASHHTDRPYPAVMNVPGLKVVCPTTPYNAKGLWKTAIRDNNPVCVFEDMRSFSQNGEVPEEEFLIPFGQPEVVLEGKDLTLVTIFTRREGLQAADQLKNENIDVELIDPLTLVPLGIEVILESVRKTGRLIIADVAHDTCSAASHIAALVAEKGFSYLRAPIKRVCTPDIHIPFASNLESLVFPTVEKIVAAAKAVVLHEQL